MKKIGFAKVRDIMKGKGFIVALVLCIAAVGLSTYYAYNTIMSSFDEGKDSENLFVDVNKPQSGIPKDTLPEETMPQETAPITTEPKNDPTNNFFSTKPPRALPLEGEVINGYSNGELVKSETLNLWQTHDGIDIKAEVGTEVKAAGEGTVLNIWEDGLWGICVSIDHGDGYVSGYYGLDKSVSVEIGKKVACGDIIGKVGNTAECECALPSHLHFEVKKDDAFIDPFTFTQNR